MKKSLLLLLLLTAAIIAYAVIENPHDFPGNECQFCHIDHEKEPRNLRAPVTDICSECHEQATLKSSHPVDVYPTNTSIPPELPVRGGMITCSTCHDIHGEGLNVFREKTYYLRGSSTGRHFCIYCHKQGISMEGHTDVIDVAHMGSRFKVTNPYEPLDPISKECISCHGGIVGKAVTFEPGSGVWTHEDAAFSHPVGINYEESREQRIDSMLKPSSLIDKRINFYEGKIGCGSCHDLYSKGQRTLVMSNKGSRLCTSCHEL